MKKIIAREEYCIGCRLCEIHCIVRRSRSKKIIKAFKTEKEFLTPGVRVEQDGPVSFALQCRHCGEALCIEACLTGAMSRDETTGAVICDQDKCVGCWMCLMVCPAGAILRSDKNHVASKCDLCMGEDTPACVANCPNEAILYMDDDSENE